jgi:protein-S-isoprenylcysteine O-methyltransferase Ste14
MVPDSLFHTLFWVLLAGLFVIRGLSAFQLRLTGQRFLPDAQAVRQEGTAAFVARLLAFFLLIGLLAAFAVNPPWMQRLDVPLGPGLRWIGFALGLGSLVIWGWAQTLLGRQWSAQVELRADHRLIHHGPYAWVRHPLYAGLAGVSIALALVTANGLFVGFALLVLAFLPVRILREEKMMLAGVPGYADYAHAVRYRLLPRIW